MPLKVLVAEEDLHAHKLIHDILEMSLKDVKITRALNRESIMSKVVKGRTSFDLILFDFHFDGANGLAILLDLLRQKPEISRKLVLLNESAQEIQENPQISQLQYILKPFSLDTFSTVVKRFRAGDL
jgi:response regulator of citrate/malate metabolism